MDVIASTAFGLKVNSQKDKDCDFVRMAKKFTDLSAVNPLIWLACTWNWQFSFVLFLHEFCSLCTDRPTARLLINWETLYPISVFLPVISPLIKALGVQFIPQDAEKFFTEVSLRTIDARKETEEVSNSFNILFALRNALSPALRRIIPSFGSFKKNPGLVLLAVCGWPRSWSMHYVLLNGSKPLHVLLQKRCDFLQLMLDADKEKENTDKEHDQEFQDMYQGFRKRSKPLCMCEKEFMLPRKEEYLLASFCLHGSLARTFLAVFFFFQLSSCRHPCTYLQSWLRTRSSRKAWCFSWLGTIRQRHR